MLSSHWLAFIVLFCAACQVQKIDLRKAKGSKATVQDKDITVPGLETPADQEVVAERAVQAHPFSRQKVSINPELLKASELALMAGGPVLPKGLTVSLVLDNECLKSGRVSLPYLSPADLVHQEGFAFRSEDRTFQVATDYNRFQTDVDEADCIVGVSEHVVYTQSSISSKDLFESLNFDAGLMPSETDSVKVAVLDTGLDLNNKAFQEVSKSLEGTNIFTLEDDPIDDNGHGTAMASLIASSPVNGSGPQGLAKGIVEILPIKVADEHGVATNRRVFDGVIRAINHGAEVINISLTAVKPGCDYLLGFAIHRAMKNKVLVVMSAGNNSQQLISAKFDGPADYRPTVSPACWGAYFKGAVTVGATVTDAESWAPFSVWGKGVEISAPGTDVPVFTLEGKTEVMNGTSASSALVSAAAAYVVSYHKSNRWDFSSWLIEDVLLNGQRNVAGLADQVRRGRVLDMGQLGTYLELLKGKSEEERQREPTDRLDIGEGFNPDKEDEGKIDRLEIINLNPVVRVGERAYLIARAYYEGNRYVNISNLVEWSSSSSEIEVNRSGILIAGKEAAKKVITIQAHYQTEAFEAKASTEVRVIATSTIGTNPGAKLKDLVIIPPADLFWGMETIPFKATAYYDDGSERDVTSLASWSSSDQKEFAVKSSTSSVFSSKTSALAGKEYEVTALYDGATTTKTIKVLPRAIERIEFELKDAQTGQRIVGNEIVKGQLVNLQPYIYPVAGFRLQVPYEFQASGDLQLMRYDFSQELASPDLSASFRTEDLPAGDYRIDLKFLYRGSGEEKEVTPEAFDLRIVEPKVARYELVPPQLISHGNAGAFRLWAHFDNGSKRRLDETTFAWTLKKADESATTQSWFDAISPSQTAKSGLYLSLFDGKPGDGFIVTGAPQSGGELKAELAFTTSGTEAFEINYPKTYADDAVPPTKAGNPLCQNEVRSGDGLEASPYLICSIEELKSLQTLNRDKCNASCWAKLGANLDFTSVGNVREPFNLQHFFLDGDGYHIKNLEMVDEEKDRVGFFANAKVIKNLGFVNPIVSGRHYVAVFAPVFLGGTIENCFIHSGNVSGEYMVGGFFGQARSLKMKRARVIGTSINVSFARAGGLAGQVEASQVIESMSSANLIGNGPETSMMGGLFGLFGEDFALKHRASSDEDFPTNIDQIEVPIILNSYFSGSLTAGVQGHRYGGLVGQNHASIVNSYAKANIVVSGGEVGGLVGLNVSESCFGRRGLLYDVHYEGEVWGGAHRDGPTHVGGLVGRSYCSIIQKANAKGKVKGKVKGIANAGMLVGTSGYPDSPVIGDRVRTGGLVILDNSGGENEVVGAASPKLIGGKSADNRAPLVRDRIQ